MKYDLVVFGGGTSGCSAAYIAAKHGVKTLLVEKTDSLGGSITQALVVPTMKVNSENINTEFYNDLLTFADQFGAKHTFIDGNEAWFNPELLKIALDAMLESVNCEILFASEATRVSHDIIKDKFSCKIKHKILSLYIDSKYIVDATGNGEIFKLLNCDFQDKNESFQTPTLRFILSNVDIKVFSEWLKSIDSDRNITPIEEDNDHIYLSTAYTWDKSINWALRPVFEEAIKDGNLDYEDTAYFQIFSIANMPGSIAFNCPRILLNENPLNPYTYSKALIQARKRIYKLLKFCNKYLPGFENAYITNIADMFGIRESYRVKGEYTLKKDDIINGKIFTNPALACDYPIDIHSNNENEDKLEFIKHTYYLPVEALISSNYRKLYGVGRIISADFESQSALRTQMSCFSMGEAAAKDIIKKLI